MTFGYDADIVKAIDRESTNSLRDHGKSLANDLVNRIVLSKTVILRPPTPVPRLTKIVGESTGDIRCT